MTGPARDEYTPFPPLQDTRELLNAMGRLVRLASYHPPYVHAASGRLVFQSAPNKPLDQVPVELRGRRSAGLKTLLGRTETDRQGGFAVAYDVGTIPGRGSLHLELRVHARTYTYGVSGALTEHPKVIYRYQQVESPDGGEHYFGTIGVPYWEYGDGVLPQAHPAGVNPNTLFPSGHQVSQARAVARGGLVRFKHVVLARMAPDLLTLTKGQADYPISPTQERERERPGSTRSDEFVGERTLNGSCPVFLSKDRSHPGWYRAWWNWDRYPHNGRYELPNVDARFELRNDNLYPVQITIQLRQPGGRASYSPLQEPMTYTPRDGEVWLQAKRVFRMVRGLSGSIDMHLIQTHLNVEQYAIAARRNLRQNPVSRVLAPHGKEVEQVNQIARQIVFGASGALAACSAFTPHALQQHSVNHLGSLDWKGWKPRRPLTSTHTFALAGQLYWDILTEYIDDFFAVNLDEIIRYWYEIQRFSDDLVAHGVPYQPRATDPDDDWFDTSELGDCNAPRQEVVGCLKAVRPITRSDQPSAEDLNNLKEACRYIIFQTTYILSYTNVRHFEEGGEVLYGSFGLRNGCVGPESDVSIALRPLDASYQLFLTRLLAQVHYGTVIGNEDRDIPPRLVELVNEHQAEFDALGFDVTTVASRINV